MKRKLALLMAMIMCLSLCACGGSPDSNRRDDNDDDDDDTGKKNPWLEEETETETESDIAIGEDATVKFQVPEGGYDGSEVTIVFYHTMGANLRGVLDRAIEDFNELYPNIKILHEQVGNYDNLCETIGKEITQGKSPNIAYCYPEHVALYNKVDAVIPLDSLIESTEMVTSADGRTEALGLSKAQIRDFVEGFYNQGKTYGDGLMYTLPLSKSTELLYYNKTFFEEHGLKVPVTWEEMEAVCERILEIDPQSIPLAYASEANWFITMSQQLGAEYTSAKGDHYLFDNKENQDFVMDIRKWYQKGYLITQTQYGAFTSGLFTAETGTKSYMSIDSSAGATYNRPLRNEDGTYPFEVGITTIPQYDVSNPKVISQGPSLCIFQKENPQEVLASWLFVKFLTTNIEFQTEFSIASGYMPVLESATEDWQYKELLNSADGGDRVAALALKVALEQKDAYFDLPSFKTSGEVREVVGELLVQCMSAEDETQIKKLFEDAVKELKYME